MNREKALENINDYYHDELEKALDIMWQLQSPYLKLEIPKHLHNEIVNFTNNFKFRYDD